MPVLFLIIVGAAAGFIATRIMEMKTDLVTTVVIGMFGALIGGLVLRFLLMLSGVAAGFVGAILGAMLLIWAWKALSARK
ncbi:GlsB/YeaQ/YmgE family stress response membrane protein [Celeribacter ethanolicus]|uniref:GlsB/YeaQ/YmgE family stress response membrane protein n=1 Tax=Celeribacter ethanolicus TaxID=1758178 RepID=A0A291GE98_9RHOB|nr:GlsB/YeaQ/YmgE family stress response membrane protein [Celeribacter ethanolicus]ATG48709.1 GlsB/YeaQ/YmgE family stress response membrane protein [Celeribacter ethanolicus]